MLSRSCARLCILAALVLGGGCASFTRITSFSHPDEPRYAANHRGSPLEATPQTITIVSYNVQLGRRTDRAIRLLQETEHLRDAGIIFLQEMDEAGVARVAEALRYNYVYYPAAVHPATRRSLGLAILSRWELAGDRKILLPHSFADKLYRMQRIAVYAAVRIGGTTCGLVNAHLGAMISSAQRVDQVRALFQSLAGDADCCLIGGDFNTYTAGSVRLVSGVFRESGFLCATSSVGWTHRSKRLLFKKASLDHVFARGLTFKGAGKVPDRSASDHCPIWAEFSLGASRRPLESEARSRR